MNSYRTRKRKWSSRTYSRVIHRITNLRHSEICPLLYPPFAAKYPEIPNWQTVGISTKPSWIDIYLLIYWHDHCKCLELSVTCFYFVRSIMKTHMSFIVKSKHSVIQCKGGFLRSAILPITSHELGPARPRMRLVCGNADASVTVHVSNA